MVLEGMMGRERIVYRVGDRGRGRQVVDRCVSVRTRGYGMD